MKTILICTCFLVTVCLILVSCNKENLSLQESHIEEFPDSLSFEIYFQDIGFTNGKIKKIDDQYKLVTSTEIRDEFIKGLTEVHAYIEDNNKIYLFKDEQSRLDYFARSSDNNSLESRCWPIGGEVEVRFYKHKNFDTEYTLLRRSGNFSIPHIQLVDHLANNQISSVHLNNQNKINDYLVTFYDYTGNSVQYGIAKCDNGGSIPSMKVGWWWFYTVTGTWLHDGPFNDKTTSMIGMYYNL